MERFDAIVVGGGPAGSMAARVLVQGGLRVAVLDRARFPRVKLCAGWLSHPIWDEIELSPTAYPRSLWQWNRCHVQFQGRTVSVSARGYFIRRYEFDDYLLHRSGAEVIHHSVKALERRDDNWVIDEAYVAPIVIGAGGTHGPVARLLDPVRSERPVGALEIELEFDRAQIAQHRLGGDGEPELLLHDDLGGYGWNVPKSNWLNVGCGTMDAKKVRAAWGAARAVFADAGHVPPGVCDRLEREARGHSYYLFDPLHLERCHANGAYLVGDELGLAQPLTAEGILPAVISGRLAAEAALAGTPEAYRQRLAAHPVMVDYDLYYRLRMAVSRLRRKPSSTPKPARPAPAGARKKGAAGSSLASGAIAGCFGWMFAGRPIPGGRALSKILGTRS